MHQCSGQIRRRFHSRFLARDSVAHEIFPAGHYAQATVSVALFTRECCLPTISATDVVGSIGRHPHLDPNGSSLVVLLFLLASGILLPRSCHRCAIFRTFLSAANTLWNAVSAFVVITSACRIIGVILLSLFSVMLSPVGSATERSSERTTLRSCHFVCVKEIPRRYAS